MVRTYDSGKREHDELVTLLCQSGRLRIGKVTLLLRGETYHAHYSLRGRRIRNSLHLTDPHEAVEAAKHTDAALATRRPAEALRALARHTDGQVSMRVATLMNLFHRNMEVGGAKPAHVKWLAMFRRFSEPMIGALRIDRVSRVHIEECVAKKADTGALGATDGLLRYLKQLFKFAVREDFLTRSPARNISSRRRMKQHIPHAFTGEKYRAQYLTPEQIKQYRKAYCGTPLEAAFMLGVYAGLRRSEIINLDWSRVNLAKGLVTVAARGEWVPKSHQARTIPMTKELRKWAARHQKKRGLVTTNAPGRRWAPRNMRRRSDAIVAAAGLTPVGFHTFRHTFGVACAGAGKAMTTIQRWMGHQGIETTQIYAHFTSEYHDTSIDDVRF